ncbi:DUF4231 domain-containing protein [Jidongwangia harbinensis]|uniref:DUF4231 domain-containing protein n=1 Tax=Jidongwangia harbinensis TaxID=2878561 RepID=UPI001CDA1F5F|nr:DUF4231 domain-containing protein [Jidongwangia harbinensis]MCA2219119.1 DUF4231 domain-containing protein [Jidongwangia harbinensis]
MADEEIPHSPQVVKLDTKIAEYQRQIRSITLGRRIGFGVGVGLIVLSIAMIVVTVIAGSDSGWLYGAVLVPALTIVAWMTIGDLTEGSTDERARAREQLRLSQIKRSEFLAGKVPPSQTIRSRYRDSLPDLIGRLRRRADRYQRASTMLQSSVIIGSLASAAVTATFADSADGRLAAVGLSLIVGICASFSTTFRFREKGANLQSTATDIEREYRMSALSVGDYAEVSEEKRLQTLAERVEEIRQRHAEREGELSQPSDVQQSGAIELQ